MLLWVAEVGSNLGHKEVWYASQKSGDTSQSLKLVMPDGVAQMNILPGHCCLLVETLKDCSSWCLACWGANLLLVGPGMGGSLTIHYALKHNCTNTTFHKRSTTRNHVSPSHPAVRNCA